MNTPLPAVRFVPGQHKNANVIRIEFDYHKELAARVKVLPGAKWSQTMRCWYVPDTEVYRCRFRIEVKLAAPAVLQKICAENEEAIAVYVRELQLKGYSRSTIGTYRKEFLQLLQTLGKVPVTTLSQGRLRDYFLWCHTVKKLTENTLHSRLNAVKFYFEVVLKGEKFYWDIPRPKKRLVLPKILGKQS